MKIAITGIGIIDSLGTNIDQCWTKVLNKETGIGHITSFDLKDYPVIKSKFGYQVDENILDFGDLLENVEKRNLDRCVKLGLYSSSKAVLDARILDKNNTAVIFSSLGAGKSTEFRAIENLLKNKRSNPRSIISAQRDFLSSIISKKFKFTGVNLSITSACSTGIVSLDYACKLLNENNFDCVLVGASDTMIDPINMYMFQSFGALNEDQEPKLRPFDIGRNGFLMGEGSACFVLQRLEDAINQNKKIYATIEGIGLSNEAYHETDMTDQGIGARLSIDIALKRAGITRNEIQYINSHATGTINGDQSEYNVLSDYFPKSIISALKPNIGHTMSACGLIESAYLLKSLNENIIPPIVNLENPIGEGLTFPKEAINHNSTYVLKNSFGFGGKCASIIYKKFIV